MIGKGAETLPNKDAQAFKQLAKFYDAKNYKKGLKNTEKLLQTHPDHPQTLALKALFLQAIGQQAKSLQIAKLALIKSKMSSMFCWHTCGTIYKAKKDFVEAAKCFQNALKYQPDNIQLMRDVSNLQVQTRDYTNFTSTRFAILKQKPNMIQNWVGFTIAHHLRGDFPSLFKALKSLDNLIKTTELKPQEQAHYYLYRIIAFRDAKDYQGMYEQLHNNKNKSQIKDDVLYNQLLYRACLQLKKTQQATLALQHLIKKYPQNTEYIVQYQQLFHLTQRQACTKIRTQFKSKIAYVYQLSCINQAQQFKKQLIVFAKPYYQKNLISLFTEIQLLYQHGKQKLIQQVLLNFHNSLQKDEYPDGSKLSSPSQYLWSYYLLAQHYSRQYNTLSKAYQYINKAIAHTCTVPQFYLVKAQIQYKQHNNINALKTINQARKTDLADRYMNNICVKYILRCELPDIAENVMKFFIRDQSNLYQLQTQWYLIDLARCLLKTRNFQAGIRHLDFIQKQFIQFQANQYDFHMYCLRKWTLRQYTQLIQFNDNIYDNKKYVEAAALAIKYLIEYPHKLIQDQVTKKIQEQDTKQQEGKKKKKKKKVNEVTQLTPHEAFRKKIDYFGKQYSEKIKKNPLQEALNYAKCVSTIKYTNKKNRKQNKQYGKAFSRSIDVFIHFKKPLLVLRCLNKLIKTQYCPFEIHLAKLKSIIYLQSYLLDPKANDMAKQLINQFLVKTLQNKSINIFNDEQTSKWDKQIPQSKRYLIAIKKKQALIIINHQQIRQQLIRLYQNQLQILLNTQKINNQQVQLIFYITHKLQFYGKINLYQEKLNLKLKQTTSYFSGWRQLIPKLPDSTWTNWWLSDYDIQRQELNLKDQSQKKMQGKESEKSTKQQTK